MGTNSDSKVAAGCGFFVAGRVLLQNGILQAKVNVERVIATAGLPYPETRMITRLFAVPALLLAVSALLLVVGTGDASAKIACLLEGKVLSQPVKDCTETSIAVPAAEYKKQCEEHNKSTADANNTLKGTVLPACPAGAQGACHGMFGTPASAYYYARDAQTLAATKASCTTQKGQWADNP